MLAMMLVLSLPAACAAEPAVRTVAPESPSPERVRRVVEQPKAFVFRAPPAAFDAVRAAGVDLVSLANNHTLDYGREGLADTLAHAAAASGPAAGADAITGTHAHLMLGGGWLGRSYVQYGLGNFLWWRDERFSNDTGVLWVRLRGSDIKSVERRPAIISRQTGQPIPADGAEQERIQRKYEDLRA